MKKYIKPETETIKMEGQVVLAASITSVGLYGTNASATQASKRNLNDDWDEDWDDEDYGW